MPALVDARRCPFDGRPLRRESGVPPDGGGSRTTWMCLRQGCTYAEPDDPQALFRFSWLGPLYRALWTRAEFRDRSLDEQWMVLQQAARQVHNRRSPHHDASDELDEADAAEVLSWLEALRRRTQR